MSISFDAEINSKLSFDIKLLLQYLSEAHEAAFGLYHDGLDLKPEYFNQYKETLASAKANIAHIRRNIPSNIEKLMKQIGEVEDTFKNVVHPEN